MPQASNKSAQSLSERRFINTPYGICGDGSIIAPFAGKCWKIKSVHCYPGLPLLDLRLCLSKLPRFRAISRILRLPVLVAVMGLSFQLPDFGNFGDFGNLTPSICCQDVF